MRNTIHDALSLAVLPAGTLVAWVEFPGIVWHTSCVLSAMRLSSVRGSLMDVLEREGMRVVHMQLRTSCCWKGCPVRPEVPRAEP